MGLFKRSRPWPRRAGGADRGEPSGGPHGAPRDETFAEGPEPDEASGLFLFDDVAQALRAERVLKQDGYEVRLVAPPPNLRAGCDLAVALPRVERPGAERLLAQHDASARSWADSLDGSQPLADLVTVVDYGAWFMVRAANMKMTVERSTGRIANTSGGGCPDVPHLNLELVGKTLAEAPRPKDLGYTLCGLMMDRAYLECRALQKESGGQAAGARAKKDGPT